MKINTLVLLLPVVGMLLFTACDKEESDSTIPTAPTPSVTGPGTVKVELTNVAGNVNVDESGVAVYTNSSGEQFSVTMLKYYLSNFTLINDSGEYSIPNTYFLVNESVQSSTSLSLTNVPEGKYSGIRFMIGVDEDRYNDYVSNPFTGSLDPANNMFWTWSTGFIHFKMEGTSPAVSSNSFVYHIAGMSGVYAGQRTVQINFNGDSLFVAGSREAEIHLMANILDVFQNPTTISLANTNNVMSIGVNSANIADNYETMFHYDHIHN